MAILFNESKINSWNYGESGITKVCYNGNVVYQEFTSGSTPPSPTPSYSGQYLTFIATESGTFKFSGNSVDYSLDSGSTWTTLASNTNSPTVNSGDTIMWKATLTPTSGIGIGTFSSTANFVAEGNPLSLLYGDNFIGVTDLSGKDYAFRYLFLRCTTLTSAENLIVAVTTLSNYCCHDMFNNCTSLTTAPKLPATIISQRCYWGMFYGCSSMTTAPELPATTLQEGSYCEMFNSCTSLTTAPTLPAATLTEFAYYRMFYNCSGINNITCLATNINASNCTTYWTGGVAASGTFTKAASMSSWSNGNYGIPYNWTVQDA